MASKEKDEYSRLLEIFDSQDLDDVHGRRTAYNPLYDYFQKLTVHIGIEFCGLKKEVFNNYQLNGRWGVICNCLILIEDPKKWNDLIKKLSKIRNGVEHNDSYDPDKDQLLKIRKDTEDFTEWIVEVAKEYYKKSKDFTFKEHFYIASKKYIERAESIIQEYGEEPPYITKLNSFMEFEEIPYQQLPELIKSLEERLKNIAKLEDIERSDLEVLIQLVKIISNLKGREEILISYPVCPKCGGEIKETQHYSGGGPEDPPSEVYIRVGCQKCDYLIHDESIDI